jgi:hypothetical protein
MRIYIFKSESRNGLRAFAGEPGGGSLPQRHGPWTATGIVPPDRDPPFNLSRKVIEGAIDKVGFQHWRMAKEKESKS